MLNNGWILLESLNRLSFCSNLVTLIIRNADLEVLPIEIFPSMNVLKVLDLSCNRKLVEMPVDIGRLLNLEYLQITDTRVARLPTETNLLKKLRFLLLNCTTLIPRGVITNLWMLKIFQQSCNEYTYVDEAKLRLMREMGRHVLGELEGLEHITDLSLVIHEAASIQILLESPKLQCCTRQLCLNDCTSLPAELDLSTNGRFEEHLEKHYLSYCDMSAIKFGSSSSSLSNLRHVSITNCNKIQNVSSLVYVPNLGTLDVMYCMSMEELIAEDVAKKMQGLESTNDDSDDMLLLLLFSSLTSLRLMGLHKLRSICPQSALPFPSLKVIEVDGCFSLEKLPFDSNTARMTPPEFKIIGHRRWWDHILQWDRQETKDAFTPKFQQPPELYYENSN